MRVDSTIVLLHSAERSSNTEVQPIASTDGSNLRTRVIELNGRSTCYASDDAAVTWREEKKLLLEMLRDTAPVTRAGSVCPFAKTG